LENWNKWEERDSEKREGSGDAAEEERNWQYELENSNIGKINLSNYVSILINH
jgi:hypothetical protein